MQIRIALLFLGCMVIQSCREEPHLWQPDSREQVMGEYIETHPEFYSEFGKLVETTGMCSLLNTRGPYTLFLPDNEAMLDYYEQKNMGSLEEFSDSALKNLVLYHLVGAEISANDIGLGALPETNAIGDYLVTEFQGSDIIINKSCRIIDRDIQAAKGYIHAIDQVIDPVTLDIFSVLEKDPSYSIFA